MSKFITVAIVLTIVAALGFFGGCQYKAGQQYKAVAKVMKRDAKTVTALEAENAKTEIIYRDRIRVIKKRNDCAAAPIPDDFAVAVDSLRSGGNSAPPGSD